MKVHNGEKLPSVDGLIFQVSDLLESGDFPVWEFVWHLNATHPNADLADKIRLARRASANLIGQDYELWRGRWPEGPVARLTDSEMQDLATDDAAWSRPEAAALLVWLRQVS